MTWTELLGVSVWLVGMVYSAIAIGIPEIRLHWRGSTIKLGRVSSVGLAWFFWGIPLLGLGARALGMQSPTLVWVIFCSVAAVIFTSGYLMDLSEQRKRQ